LYSCSFLPDTPWQCRCKIENERYPMHAVGTWIIPGRHEKPKILEIIF
jgi:hypothetical protein